MSDKWEALTTAEDVIAAFKAGRHVEFTACGDDYDLPRFSNRNLDSDGWVIPYEDRSSPAGVREAFELGEGRRYRALIEGGEP